MKANQLLVPHFSGLFLLTASLRRQRMSMNVSLFTVEIYVNYTAEFRELFEATMYILDNFTLPYFSVLNFRMFYKVYSEPEQKYFTTSTVAVCRSAVNMRASLSVYSAIAVTVLVLLVLCDCATSASSYQNTRNKPRTIRGFKNVALSTARGFGKRDGSVMYTAGNGNTAAEPAADR